jgi:hypothetical protein
MNSDCDSFPSLFASALLKFVSTPCAWLSVMLPDFALSRLDHRAVQSP